MSSAQQDFWTEYYKSVYATPNQWLDYSNERVQVQTFGVAIESAGSVVGKRCLDVGCGRGQFSLCLSGLQAGEVVGVDIFADTIRQCRERHPHVRWEVGSPEDADFCAALGDFDAIFLLEVLQCVNVSRTLSNLWRHLRPGGRLVAVVPNKDNAIVQNTMTRFSGTFLPPNPAELRAIIDTLPDVDCWAYRGMDFQQDQRLVPYAVTPWTTQDIPQFQPNRLAFAIRKRAAVQTSRDHA